MVKRKSGDEAGRPPAGSGGGRGRRRAPADPPSPRSARGDAVVERLGESLDRKAAKLEQASTRAAQKLEVLNRKAARIEEVSAKAAQHLETLERLSDHLGALDVWTRLEPAGRRPRFSREQIAAAAMRIADAEGFDALSMRRLAAELGAGTMTLYHYVRTKDELLTLVTDAVLGEVVVPEDDGLPDDWRAAITLIAGRTRDTLRRHPWVLDLAEDPAVGPNSVRHFDQTLQALAGLEARLEDKLDLVAAVDSYVFGHCLHERTTMPVADAAEEGDVMAYVETLLATGEYPQLAALAERHGMEGAWRRVHAHLHDPDGFDRNLARLLDGFARSFTTPAGDAPAETPRRAGHHGGRG